MEVLNKVFSELKTCKKSYREKTFKTSSMLKRLLCTEVLLNVFSEQKIFKVYSLYRRPSKGLLNTENLHRVFKKSTLYRRLKTSPSKALLCSYKPFSQDFLRIEDFQKFFSVQKTFERSSPYRTSEKGVVGEESLQKIFFSFQYLFYKIPLKNLLSRIPINKSLYERPLKGLLCIR